MSFDIPPMAFPLKPFETATSYVSRLTRYCGLERPSDLCLDFGFRWQDFVRGDDHLFARLCRISGADARQMKRWAVRSKGIGRFEVAGQQGTTASLSRTRLRLCPACIQDDISMLGENHVYRRYYWQLNSICSCQHHSCELIVLPQTKYTIDSYDFVGQVKQHLSLVQSARQTAAKFTPFENYLLKRHEGIKAYPFLDGLPAHIASRLCELLGHMLISGAHVKIRSVPDQNLSYAAQAGFEALSQGKEGLITAFDALRSHKAHSTPRYRLDYGSLFDWLRTSQLMTDLAPIKDILRQYIFEHYPVPQDVEVLRKPCPERRMHTVQTARASLGIQRVRMNRYLLDRGLAKIHDGEDAIRLIDQLPTKAIQKISKEMQRRVNSIEAQSILGVSENVLHDLCEFSIVTKTTDSLDQIPKYDRRKLSLLLDRLAAKATINRNVAPQIMDILTVSTRLRCKSAQIVEMILARRIKTVFRFSISFGIADLLVDIEEVRCALPQVEMQGLTRSEASVALRVTYQTVNFLVSKGLLKSERAMNSKSRQYVNCIPQASIDTFLAKHDTLGLMSKRYRRAAGPFGCHLVAKGICPLEAPKGISWIYEKRGLEARINRLGIEVPVQPKGG